MNSVLWLASFVVCRYGAALLVTSCLPTTSFNTGLCIDGLAPRFSRSVCRNPYSISAMDPSMASRTAVVGTMSFNHSNSKPSDMVAVGTSFGVPSGADSFDEGGMSSSMESTKCRKPF